MPKKNSKPKPPPKGCTRPSQSWWITGACKHGDDVKEESPGNRFVDTPCPMVVEDHHLAHSFALAPDGSSIVISGRILETRCDVDQPPESCSSVCHIPSLD